MSKDEELLATFIVAGGMARSLLANVEYKVRYDMLLVGSRNTMQTDVVLGIVREETVVVMRPTDKSTDFLASSEGEFKVYILSHLSTNGMHIGAKYVIGIMALANMTKDTYECVKEATLGVYTDARGKSLIVCHRADVPHEHLFDGMTPTPSTLMRSGLQPVYFGSKEKEIKNPQAALHLWVSGLNLTTLRKGESGTKRDRIGYEICNGNKWQKATTWKQVVDTAEAESNLSFTDEFLNYPEKFPSIAAMGRKAFICRRKKKELH